MNVYQTILRPIITEKSTHTAGLTAKERGAAYTFEVAAEATKVQIRDAIEKLYNVKVVRVNTVTRKGEHKRFKFRPYRTKPIKRAIVYVDKNSNIDLF
jgi:large subunit ribosomal protein L23